MIHWLAGLPIGVSLSLSVIAFGVYGTGFFLLARRWYNPRGERQPADGAPLTTLTGAAAVFLFGFTIVTLSTAFNAARDEVTREVNLVAGLHAYFGSFPQPVASRLDAALTAYVREIVDVEFPALARDEDIRPNERLASQLGALLFSRATPGLDTRIGSAMVGRFLELDELRHRRLTTGSGSMPRTIWIALLAIALLSMTANAFIVHRSFRTQLVLIALLSTAYGLLFFVAVQLDYPFTGPTAISSAPFLDALAR